MTSSKIAIMLFLITFGTQTIKGQTLIEFIEEAWQQNPEILAYQQGLNIQEEKVNEAIDFPNTKLSAGYFVSGPQTRTGEQKARFGASQPLPWFGSIKAKKAKAKAQIEVVKNRLDLIKRKISLDVANVYYGLYELKAKENILHKQDTLINSYLQVALGKVKSNTGSTVEVLKLTIKKNNLLEQKEILAGQMLSQEDALNQLLHRDGFQTLRIPDNLYIPEEEPTLLLDDIEYHPELLHFDYLQEVVDKDEAINQKDKKPSLGIGLDYIVVQERMDLQLIDNGKDIIMPNVSLSIPFLSKKNLAKSNQYRWQKEKVVLEREAKKNQLENLLQQAVNSRITARISYTTQQKNIDQALHAKKIVITGYQAGLADFSELLDIQQMIFDLEQKKIEAIATYFRQSALLNYLQ